jgi:hypothetical protein
MQSQRETRHSVLLLVVIALVVAGCSTPLSTREKGALAGGAIGAGAGAAIGSASGNTGTGALIGAGVGVVGGALIGDAMQANEQKQAAPPPPPPPPPPVRAAPAPVVVAPPPPAAASVQISVGHRPPLVVVPGTPVYYAPNLAYDYFAYGGRFFVYEQDAWFTAAAYNGPWMVIGLERVPRPVLGVPVKYYKAPPKHWKEKHGPPPWAHAKGHAKKKGDDD